MTGTAFVFMCLFAFIRLRMGEESLQLHQCPGDALAPGTMTDNPVTGNQRWYDFLQKQLMVKTGHSRADERTFIVCNPALCVEALDFQ